MALILGLVRVKVFVLGPFHPINRWQRVTKPQKSEPWTRQDYNKNNDFLFTYNLSITVCPALFIYLFLSLIPFLSSALVPVRKSGTRGLSQRAPVSAVCFPVAQPNPPGTFLFSQEVLSWALHFHIFCQGHGLFIQWSVTCESAQRTCSLCALKTLVSPRPSIDS